MLRHFARPRVALPLMLTALLGAQTQTIVSPVGLATAEGNASNAFPWNDQSVSPTRVYQQIHSDLGTTVRLLKKLAWRANGGGGTTPNVRTNDLELFLGPSVNYDQASWIFARNYVGTRTSVVPRQVINFGPLTGGGSPAPFNFGIPLPTPYMHVGTTSLCWEAVIHSSSGTFVTIDAHSSSITSATFASTGPGCTASGQASPMLHGPRSGDYGGTLIFGTYVEFAPKTAPLILAIGATNPNLTIPGLCGGIYTDLLLMLPIGSSDATGFLGTIALSTKFPAGPGCFALPNTAQGATLFTQVLAPDVGSTMPIPIATSDGKTFTVPTSNLSVIAQVTRIYNNSNSVTDPWAYFADAGYGIVTEFTY